MTVNANSVVCSSFMLVRVGYEGELRYRFLLVFSFHFSEIKSRVLCLMFYVCRRVVKLAFNCFSSGCYVYFLVVSTALFSSG